VWPDRWRVALSSSQPHRQQWSFSTVIVKYTCRFTRTLIAPSIAYSRSRRTLRGHELARPFNPSPSMTLWRHSSWNTYRSWRSRVSFHRRKPTPSPRKIAGRATGDRDDPGFPHRVPRSPPSCYESNIGGLRKTLSVRCTPEYACVRRFDIVFSVFKSAKEAEPNNAPSEGKFAGAVRPPPLLAVLHNRNCALGGVRRRSIGHQPLNIA
jgi:hypothetical protein